MHYLILLALTFVGVLFISNWAKNNSSEVVKRAIYIFSIVLFVPIFISFLISGRLLWALAIIIVVSLIIYPLTIINKNSDGNMKVNEAKDILGINGDLSEEKINEAYKKMIKKSHPDVGGSTYLSQKIIKARKTLIKNL